MAQSGLIVLDQDAIDRNLLFTNVHLVEVQKFILSYLSKDRFIHPETMPAFYC